MLALEPGFWCNLNQFGGAAVWSEECALCSTGAGVAGAAAILQSMRFGSSVPSV